MNKAISKILREMHEFDQRTRKKIVKRCGRKLKNAKNKFPFHELKGQQEQRLKIVKTLIKYTALSDKMDYRYAGAILINSSRKSDYYLACKMYKQYYKLGGKRINLSEGYYKKMGWNKKDMEKKIGLN